MYTLQIELKQHTPLIHFQHDQDDATLRASEVKPKLDRFLIETLELIELDKTDKEGKKMKPKEKYKSWFINEGKQHLVLDYKMRIVAEQIEVQEIPKLYPCFFGNTGSLADRKEFVFAKKIVLTIQCHNAIFKERINENIGVFFNIHNFGTRGSKGFGSFAIQNQSISEFENDLKQYSPIVFKMQIGKLRSIIDEHKTIFSKIDSEYKNLKSGQNKITSRLKQYFNNMPERIEWEKAKLQSIVNEIPTGKKPIIINKINTNYQFVRAFLGLAENFSYPRHNDIKIKVSHVDKDNKVERFPSPILFKVFENNIYLLCNIKVNTKYISGKEFNFEYEMNGKDQGKSHRLKVPDIDFNLTDFLSKNLNNTSWKNIMK